MEIEGTCIDLISSNLCNLREDSKGSLHKGKTLMGYGSHASFQFLYADAVLTDKAGNAADSYRIRWFPSKTR